MWNRKELKENAKALLEIHYWKVLAATIILGLYVGGGSTNMAYSQNSADVSPGRVLMEKITAMDLKMVLAALAAALSALVMTYLTGFLISIFIFHPLEVGAKKLLINCKENHAAYGNILFSLKNSYGNIVKTMFCKWLFTKLWGLLFAIPGVIKYYEYRMIPYLLAENPQMSSKEAFSRSREMMLGNKWNAFILDLSFVGWHILGICTFGIVELFFSAPYCNMANAELYHELKNNGTEIGEIQT